MPLLLCDLDDTLVERTALFRRWAASFVDDRGLDPAALEAIVEEDGAGRRPRDEFVAAVNRRLRLDPPLSSTYQADYVGAFVPGDGVLDALTAARGAGWTIVVVSNGGLAQLSKLAVAGLEPFVDDACVSGIEGVRKPDPRLFRLASERTGVPLDEAWMVGDDPDADVGGAAAAGVRSVWLHREREWPRDLPPPTAAAGSFPEAVHLVLRSTSGPDRR